MEETKMQTKRHANDYCMGGPFETAGDANDHDVHVILYHWSICGPCQRFLKIWNNEGEKVQEEPTKPTEEKVQGEEKAQGEPEEPTEENKIGFLQLVRKNPNSRIYASTCEREHIPTNIPEINVASFPTIMMIYGDKTIKYEGERNAQVMFDYALSLVNEVSKDNLNKESEKNNNVQSGGKTKDENYYKYKYYKYKSKYLKKKELLFGGNY